MTHRQWPRTLLEVLVVDPRVLWFALLVPVFVLVVASATGPTATLSQRLTWGASLLQIFGILQVAYGLHGLRVQLGQPTLRSLFRGWALKFRSLLWRGKSVTVIATGVGAVAMAGSATARGISVDRSSLESRVAALERRVEWLEGDLPAQIAQVNRRLDGVSSDVQSEALTRRAETAGLRSLLTELFIGGLDLEVAGLAWILFGQVVATFPDAFASIALLQRLTG